MLYLIYPNFTNITYIITEILNKTNGMTILYNSYVYYIGIGTTELIKQSN